MKEQESNADLDSSSDTNDQLLTLSFNQDGGCLAVGTANGFRICNVCPYQETFRRTFSTNCGGGIGSIEMLFRCNLSALVGGGTIPQYPPNKVLLWDDHVGKPIGELSFRQRVLAVRLRRDRICVALSDQVYVYNFGNLALLDTIVTGGAKNGLGLLCISTDAGGSSSGGDDGGMVLACPSVTRGQVRVELYGLRKTVLIDAHEGPLAAMALSVDGSLLATASTKGTIIRIFETGKKRGGDSLWNNSSSSNGQSSHPPGTPIREFRRGVEHAAISSLCFSLDKAWLACTSDRETVHIFRIYDDDQDEETNGQGNTHRQKVPSKPNSSIASASKFAKRLLPSVLTTPPKKYLQGEQSFVQVRGGITRPQICAFVPDQPHTIAIAGLDDYGNGCLMLASFGSNVEKDSGSRREGAGAGATTNRAIKGEAKRLSFHRFFKKGIGKNYKSPNDVYRGDSQVTFSNEQKKNEETMDEMNRAVSDMNFEDADDFISISPDEDSSDTSVRQTEGAISDSEERKVDTSTDAMGENDGQDTAESNESESNIQKEDNA